MSDGIVQPALIIGAGGSGVEVVRRFKRRFRDVYPETPYVQLLGIDTAPQEQELAEVPSLSPSEFIYASDFNMDFFVGEDYIDRSPPIRAWWREYSGLNLRHIKAGAGMKRPVGRLALFVHFDILVERLRSRVRRIFDNEVFNNLPEHYRRSINIYIVSSTCGGTGTGMFLDLAYVVREVVRDVMPGITVRSRGLFFLPSVFLGTGQVPRQNASRLRANAHGALTELDYAMSREADLEPVEYPSIGSVERGDPPFQTVYLVGNQTVAGALFDDFNLLLERASVHLQIELASPLTDKGDARMDNVLTAIAALAPVEGKERAYSSFADDWIELPSARLIVRWTKHLSRRLLDRLGAQVSDADKSPGKESYTSLDSVDGYGRLRGLRGAGGLGPFLPHVDSEIEQFMDVGSEGRDLGDLVRRAQVLQGAAMHQLRDTVELVRIVDDAVEEIPDEIRQVCKDLIRRSSLREVVVFLDAVEKELRRWLSAARSEASLPAPDAWIASFSHDLGQSKPGLLGKKRHTDQQRQLVIDAAASARTAWQDMLKARIAGMVQDRIPQVLHSVTELQSGIQRAVGYVGAASVLIDQMEEPTMPAGLRSSAITDEDIDAAFHSVDRMEQLESEASSGLGALLDVPQLTVEAMADAVRRESSRAVRTQAPEFLENLAIPEREIADRLSKLSPLAVYRADWSANPQSGHVQSLRILGLPQSSEDRAQQIRELLPPKMATDTETAIHRDEDRVVMTVQHHGFPLFALAGAKDIHDAYTKLESIEQNLCFVSPERDVREWSYAPVVGTEARLYFCLAIALGMIRQVGPGFLFNLGRPNSQDIVFSHGTSPEQAFQNAADEFVRGGHASAVQRHVRQREYEDTTRLYSEITAWVSKRREPGASTPDQADTLRECIERVAEYARKIKPI